MKTKLLIKLRKEAEKKYFVSYSSGKYYVMDADDYVFHDGRCVRSDTDKERILSGCDFYRREYILRRINFLKKNKRIY